MAEELPLSWQQCYRKSWNHREKSKCRQCWLALWWYTVGRPLQHFKIFLENLFICFFWDPLYCQSWCFHLWAKQTIIQHLTQSHIGPLALVLVVWGIKHYTTQRIKFEDICLLNSEDFPYRLLFLCLFFPIGYYFFVSIFPIGYYFFVSISL